MDDGSEPEVRKAGASGRFIGYEYVRLSHVSLQCLLPELVDFGTTNGFNVAMRKAHIVNIG